MKLRRITSVLVMALAAVLAGGFWALIGVKPAQAQSTWTVCPSGCDFTTITAALADLNVLSGDTIQVSVIGTHYENVVISSKDIIIVGLGRYVTTINGSATGRVFWIQTGRVVTIKDLLITNGAAGSANGGGVLNNGNLTLSQVVVRGNSTANTRNGGGLDNTGTVTITESVFENNSSGSGGGIRNFQGIMIIDQTTINNNQSLNGAGGGGGVYNHSGVSLIIANSTISGNSTSGRGGGIFSFNNTTSPSTITAYTNHLSITGNSAGTGGNGIEAYTVNTGNISRVEVKNSILAINGTVDCAASAGGLVVSLGYNSVGATTTCSFTSTGDTTGANPVLGPLALNGGKNKTHVLLDGSPAINAIPNLVNGCGDVYSTDQRSKPRGDAGSNCDIGAFERQATDLTGQVSTWTLNTPTLIASTGITVTVTSGDPGTVTVLNRDEFPGGGFSSGELQVVWTITASAEPFTADLEFCVPDDVSEMTLSAWRWNEATFAWEDQGGTQAGQCVTVTGVTGFSPWTVASNSPTAITLTDFTAQSARSTLAVSLGIVLLAGFLLLLYRRRRAGDF